MRLLVLYGSETGTAQDVAEQIWRESKCWGFTGPVLPMDEYPLQLLTGECLAVFVAATTGNGDEPHNMRQSWKFLLRRNLPADSLVRLQFACLGLGDSSYAKFNYTAKKLSKRLLQLGASNVIPLGLCDDQHDHGYGATMLPWTEQLFRELAQRFSLTQRAQSRQPVSKWLLEVKLHSADGLADLDTLQWPLAEPCQPFTLQLNQRITAADHFQDVRYLQFRLHSAVSWNPGDVLQIRPQNSDAYVADFFALVAEHGLGFTAGTVVQLTSAYTDMLLPLAYAQPVTVGLLAKYIWDFSHKPRQRAFEIMAQNCEDELEREKLEEFTTAAGLDSLINYVNRPRRTILEVLQDFRHATAKLTLPQLFELFPIIQARSFSIASTPAAGTLDLLVAVVEYKSKMSTPRLGLCSNWLKSLPPGSRILGAIKRGTMPPPQNADRPLIMVGPGTGIAPFRSFIQWRAEQKRSAVQIGPIIVFFGCRNKAKDFHFAADLTKWHDQHLIELFVAFSRDQEEKVYVQHLIRENGPQLDKLLRDENAIVYVSGASKNMPKDVREAFTAALGGDAAFIEHLIKTKRYNEETW